MNMITIDVSHIDTIGEGNHLSFRAKLRYQCHGTDGETISYEILTSLAGVLLGSIVAKILKAGYLMNPFFPIGRIALDFMEKIGRLGVFACLSLSHILRPPFYFRHIGRQMITVGFYSLPVVGLTTFFAGMVLALQSYTGFARFSAESAIPNVVVLSITRELAPVLTGLMLAGRVGAAMAAELATMRVTEQLDALETLSTNPFKYLIVPRIVASISMMPIWC